MDEREFFDLIYQHWAKTTGANDTYWMPEKHKGKNVYYIDAVAQDESRKRVASYLSSEDADFITALHGCLPDLVRRAHEAIDDAERFDYNRDERECRIAELELENQELRKEIADLKYELEEIGR